MSAADKPTPDKIFPLELVANHVTAVSKDVNCTQLNRSLFGFLLFAGQLYYYLFSRSLVVTSGNDGQHVAGSKHYQNKAVDLRTMDLDPEQQHVFLMLLIHLSRIHNVGVFDERRLVSGPHVHVEVMI